MLASISKVEDLALGQKDKSRKQFPQKQFKMENCIRNWHIFGFSQHNDQLVCFNISPMSVVNGETHNIQTRKYDISMTSTVAKNI